LFAKTFQSLLILFSSFGDWLDLYNQFPQKVLSFKSPYEAVKQLINPRNVVKVKELIGQYLIWVRKNLELEGVNKPDNTKIVFATKKISQFLVKYQNWPITDFGPDELKDVQQGMTKYRYRYGKKKVRYTHKGINDNIKHIQKICNWSVGREFATGGQARRVKEVKLLRIGQGIDLPKRQKVSEENFEKVVKNVNTVIADMLWLIWYTAMQPGEVCKIRSYDILRGGPDC